MTSKEKSEIRSRYDRGAEESTAREPIRSCDYHLRASLLGNDGQTFRDLVCALVYTPYTAADVDNTLAGMVANGELFAVDGCYYLDKHAALGALTEICNK